MESGLFTLLRGWKSSQRGKATHTHDSNVSKALPKGTVTAQPPSEKFSEWSELS